MDTTTSINEPLIGSTTPTTKNNEKSDNLFATLISYIQWFWYDLSLTGKIAALIIFLGCVGIGVETAAAIFGAFSALIPIPWLLLFLAILFGGAGWLVNCIENPGTFECITSFSGENIPHDHNTWSIKYICDLRKALTQATKAKDQPFRLNPLIWFWMGFFAFLISGMLFALMAFAVIHGVSFLSFSAITITIITSFMFAAQEFKTWSEYFIFAYILEVLAKIGKDEQKREALKNTAFGTHQIKGVKTNNIDDLVAYAQRKIKEQTDENDKYKDNTNAQVGFWVGKILSILNLIPLTISFTGGLAYALFVFSGGTLGATGMLIITILGALISGFCQNMFYGSTVPKLGEKYALYKNIFTWSWRKNSTQTFMMLFAAVANGFGNGVITYVMLTKTASHPIGLLLKGVAYTLNPPVIITLCTIATIISFMLALVFFLDKKEDAYKKENLDVVNATTQPTSTTEMAQTHTHTMDMDLTKGNVTTRTPLVVNLSS